MTNNQFRHIYSFYPLQRRQRLLNLKKFSGVTRKKKNILQYLFKHFSAAKSRQSSNNKTFSEISVQNKTLLHNFLLRHVTKSIFFPLKKNRLFILKF